MGRVSFDYSKLRGRIIEKFGSYGNYADSIDYSKQTLSNKLNNRTKISVTDIIIFCKALDIPSEEIDSYFFTTKV